MPTQDEHNPIAESPADVTGNQSQIFIILRTHYFDSDIAALHSRLTAEGAHVVVGVDETTQTVDVPRHIETISLNRGLLEEMRLYAPTDVGWRCGDYMLYCARRNYPGYRHYWMMEPDVRVNSDREVALFETLNCKSDADFLAVQLSDADQDWFWTPLMSPFVADVKRCIFGVVRLSGVALDHLLNERQILSSNLDTWEGLSRRWPNDESFVATVLASSGFTCFDLNDFGSRLTTKESYSLRRPIASTTFESLPRDDLVYHPVLRGARFRSRAEAQLDGLSKKALKQRSPVPLLPLDEHFFHQLEAECGPEAALELRLRLRETLSGVRCPLMVFQLMSRLRAFVRRMNGLLSSARVLLNRRLHFSRGAEQRRCKVGQRPALAALLCLVRISGGVLKR